MYNTVVQDFVWLQIDHCISSLYILKYFHFLTCSRNESAKDLKLSHILIQSLSLPFVCLLLFNIFAWSIQRESKTLLGSGVLSWHKITSPHWSNPFIPWEGLVTSYSPCVLVSVGSNISSECFPGADLDSVRPEVCHAVICTAAVPVHTTVTVTLWLLFSV